MTDDSANPITLGCDVFVSYASQDAALVRKDMFGAGQELLLETWALDERGNRIGGKPGWMMNYEPINFSRKLRLFTEQWQPKVVAEMNDYQFKVVKLEGDFVWHDHKDTDETFIVLEGVLRIDFRDGAVHVAKGEMYVVPKGLEHKPYAENEVHLLLIEPRGVVNTGHEGGERTAENDVWI